MKIRDWMIRGIKEEQYDIYIMDIRMEKMDGIEAAKKIRAEYPEPIIIFADQLSGVRDRRV